MKNINEEKLSNGPLMKTILSVGMPTFLAQLVNLMYNIIDRMYIGHIKECGAASLTGLGICFPVIMLITAFANLIGNGGAPFAGIALGSGDKRTSEKILGNSFSLIIVASIVLMIVFQLIKRPFLFAFGASEITYEYAEAYLHVYLWGTIFIMISVGLNYFVSVQGASLQAMFSVLIGAVLNIVLDPLFLFVFKWGIRGAAVATVISQGASAIAILIFLFSKKSLFRIKLVNLKPDNRIIKQILSLGISPFIMSATESIITIVLNSSAQKYGGDFYVGSITIAQSIMQMICSPMSGFTQGVQSIISYNYGAKNYDRLKKTCTYLIFITFSFSMILGLLVIVFPAPIAAAFTDDIELITLCKKVLPIFILGMTVFGIQCGCQSCFIALGKVKQSLFFALFRKVILLTPLAIIIPYLTNSVMGLYYAEPISDIISALLCLVVFIFTINRMLKENDMKTDI